MKPSWSAFFQKDSALAKAWPSRRRSVAPCAAHASAQYSLTSSIGETPGVLFSADTISSAVRPSYSGATSGCVSDTVPSNARTSPQDSRKCASGMCQ